MNNYMDKNMNSYANYGIIEETDGYTKEEMTGMGVNVVDKPTFRQDQIVSATAATKKFADVRKRAKTMPQFISEHNQIDSVVMDYQAYEEMYMELSRLRDLLFYDVAAQRLREGDADAGRKGKSLKDAMGDKEYEAYGKIDPDAIPDEDLFE